MSIFSFVLFLLKGDGRMDSHGHSAQCCTYTLMNQADKRILAMEVVDKKQTSLKSVIMAAEGFKRALTAVQTSGSVIKELVTDAQPQISLIMSMQYNI